QRRLEARGEALPRLDARLVHRRAACVAELRGRGPDLGFQLVDLLDGALVAHQPGRDRQAGARPALDQLAEAGGVEALLLELADLGRESLLVRGHRLEALDRGVTGQ